MVEAPDGSRGRCFSIVEMILKVSALALAYTPPTSVEAQN